MRIEAQTLNDEIVQLELNLDGYIQGPVASMLCQSGDDRDPYEVFEGSLPLGYESLNDDDLLSMLEEICLSAVRAEDQEIPVFMFPAQVKVGLEDLSLLKQRFFTHHGLEVLSVLEPDSAA